MPGRNNWWRDWRGAWSLVRAGGGGLRQHWMLATFSLVAAFALWFVIQDVENPRVNGFVPPESDTPAVVIQPQNVPSGYVVAEPEPVRIKVEARKDELSSLTPADFDATIDLKDQPAGVAAPVAVHVTSKRSGVRVIGVTPSTVTVTLQKAETKQMNVNVHRIGQLPANYEESNQQPVVDPATVTVTGLPSLVDSVATVDLDVDMTNVRSNTPIERPLVARTETGSTVTVTLSQTQAKVTFSIVQTFSQRTLSALPNVTGQPAPGYRITAVLLDPPALTVTGPPDTVNSLTTDETKPSGLPLERLDISGAATNVDAVRKVNAPANVSVDHQTVHITVVIKPIECSTTQAGAPCSGTTFLVPPVLSKAPDGLTVDTSTKLSVQVQVYGPLDQLNTLKVSDIKATVSLDGGKAGAADYPVSVSVPAGLTAVAPDPVTVTLVALP